jgi:hypothetical protein
MSKQIVTFAALVVVAASLWQCSSDSSQANCGEPLPLYNVRDAGADVDLWDSAAFQAAVKAGCVTAPMPPPTIWQ